MQLQFPAILLRERLHKKNAKCNMPHNGHFMLPQPLQKIEQIIKECNTILATGLANSEILLRDKLHESLPSVTLH